MNREIVFRGKSINGGKWLYGYLGEAKGKVLQSIYKEKVIFENLEWFNTDNFGYVVNDYMVVEETIGQFTGLYDRNQKPIYEGDIVQWEECVADYTFITQKSEVFYSENSASFEPLNEFDYCDFEVIGNIHDNKELLNED